MTESKILTGMRQALEHAKGRAAQHPFAVAAAVFATVDADEDETEEERNLLDAWAQEIVAGINGALE